MFSEALVLDKNITMKLCTGTSEETRKLLFKEALSHAKNAKVLYILKEELTELPQLSQDIAASRNSMKMISFLYAQSLECLLENLSTLPNWQQVPTTIILDGLHNYCPKAQIQNALALIALLIDSARSCFQSTAVKSNIVISVDTAIVGDSYCSLIKDLF